MNEAFTARLQKQKQRHAERDLTKSLKEMAGRYQKTTRMQKPTQVEQVTERFTPRIVATRLHETENIPDHGIEYHDSQLAELLMRLNDQGAELQSAAQKLVVLLHAGGETAEKTEHIKSINCHALSLTESARQLNSVALEFPPGLQLQPLLDSALTQEAKHWKKLLENQPQINSIRGDDPRIGALLSPLLQLARVEVGSTPSLANAISDVLERERDPLDPAALTRRLQTARERIEELSGLWMEQERDELLTLLPLRHNAGRNARIIARRYGFDGKQGGTLQEVAGQYGVSRERIRQICTPFENEISKLGERTVFAPVLDNILTQLARRAPLTEKNAQEVLDSFPDVTQILHIKDLLQWASWMGRGDVLSIEEIGRPAPMEKYVVHPAGTQETAQLMHATHRVLLKTARREVSRWGVAHLDIVLEKCLSRLTPDDDNAALDAQFVEKILAAQPNFQWLDKESGWFWFSDTKRNGLLTQIRKVFAVTSHISVGELRAAVSRSYRREGFAPPRKVLSELCRQLPELRVEDEDILLEPPLNLSSKLSCSETILWNVLRAGATVAARPKLEIFCVERGMNRVSFYAVLNSSPIVQRFASGVFGLCGAQPTTGEMETAIESLGAEYSRLRRRVLQDFGWTANGEIWLSYQISAGILNSGTTAFPMALHSFLQGSFSLSKFDESPCGTLTFGANQAWGLRPFLRRSGAEFGDYLLLVVHPGNRWARVAIGDENLLEEWVETISEDEPAATSSPAHFNISEEKTEVEDTPSLFQEIEIRELFNEAN